MNRYNQLNEEIADVEAGQRTGDTDQQLRDLRAERREYEHRAVNERQHWARAKQAYWRLDLQNEFEPVSPAALKTEAGEALLDALDAIPHGYVVVDVTDGGDSLPNQSDGGIIGAGLFVGDALDDADDTREGWRAEKSAFVDGEGPFPVAYRVLRVTSLLALQVCDVGSTRELTIAAVNEGVEVPS